MNIKQTFTFAVIALLVGSFAYCDSPKSLLTQTSRASSRSVRVAQRDTPKSALPDREFAQVDQPKAAAPVGANPKAQEVLNAASEKLKSHASVRANMTLKMSMQTHSFTARGSYLQGQNLQLRMEFSVELGAQKGSLLEVCDGQVLWTRHDLGEKDQTTITRRDVRQILHAAEQAEQRISSADQKTQLHASILADLGIGGMPALLAAFAKDYDYKSVTAGKIDDREVIVLEGTWNSKYREMWQQGPKSKDKSASTLPGYIPDLVRISVDQETEFPRRIEFLKQLPGQSAPSPMLTMDFTKVVFNGKVGRDDFVFIPPQTPAPIDVTQMYLQRLAPPKKDTKPSPSAEKAAKKD